MNDSFFIDDSAGVVHECTRIPGRSVCWKCDRKKRLVHVRYAPGVHVRELHVCNACLLAMVASAAPY